MERRGKKDPAGIAIPARIVLLVKVVEPLIILLRWAKTIYHEDHHACFILLLIPTSPSKSKPNSQANASHQPITGQSHNSE